MRNRNPPEKIGTGRLIDPDVYKLYKIRTCGRELRGAERGPSERCSMHADRFDAACRYHITPAERDAALMARIAFRMGVERGWQTKKGSEVWPHPVRAEFDDPDYVTQESEAEVAHPNE